MMFIVVAMGESSIILIFLLVLLLLLIIIPGIYVLRSLQRAGPDEVLVVSQPDAVRIHTSRALAPPMISHVERISLAPREVKVACVGEEGLRCEDGARADIRVTFSLSLHSEREDILYALRTLGSDRLGDEQALAEFYRYKFREALMAVAALFRFEEIETYQEDFCREVMNIIGADLNGLVLEELTVDHLEQAAVA